MTKNLKTGLVAAAIAIVIGLAVSYRLISQETGDEIRTQTEQILNEDDATGQPPAKTDTNVQPSRSEGTQPPATTTPDANQPNDQSSE